MVRFTPEHSPAVERVVTPPRRTPRVSLIVVVPESHVVSPDTLAQRLPNAVNGDVDVVVACAGQPANLPALQRTVGAAQFILAPAGTTPEDLRELAMSQASGDIVTLLSGEITSPAESTESMQLSS
jgi:hypothetical protein